MNDFPEKNNGDEEEKPLGNQTDDVSYDNQSDTQNEVPSEISSEPITIPIIPSNLLSPADEPKLTPWFKAPDIKPEPGYNPYRDEESVFTEIYKENPGAYRGLEYQEGEDAYSYSARRYAEYRYTKRRASQKLKNSSNFAALLSLIFILAGIGVQIPAVMYLSGIAPGLSEAEYNNLFNIINYVLMAIQYSAVFPLVLLIGTLGSKCKCKTFFKRPETSPLFTFRWCIISLGATYIVAMIFDSIFEFLQKIGMNVNDISSELPSTPLDLALYGFFVVICAPLFEELMFRGIMLNKLKKYGGIFACIVTGVFFGLIHQNHSQLFFATALGIIFAIMDLKSGSIIPSIIAHFVVNAYSFLNTLIASQTNYNEVFFGDGSVTELDGPLWALFGMGLLNVLIYIVMAAAIVLFIVEIVKFPQTFKPSKGDSMLTSREKAKAFLSSPIVIITILILALSIFTTSFLPKDSISNMINEMQNMIPIE